MMKEARMFVFALAMMLTTTACGATEPEANDGVDDTPERSDADYLAEASDKDSKDGKADSPAPCGQEMCDRALCGYDCTTSGTQCERACSSTDARADSYVLFNVSGAEDACLQLGGFLASIHSDAEQVGLTTLQFTSNCVLIDL